MRRVTRHPGLVALLAASCLAAGCGDENVWARWRAEQSLYRARSLERRLLKPGRSPGPAAYARVEARYELIVSRFPAARWAGALAETGPARQVGAATAEAALALVGLEALQGRDSSAAVRAARAESAFAERPDIVARAAVARRRALARLGRFDEALEERRRLAAMDPVARPGPPRLIADVLTAPLDLAAELRERGAAAEADSVLARAARRFAGAMPRLEDEDQVRLCDAIVPLCAARGDARGALLASRFSLLHSPAWQAPDRVKAMAATAYDAGAPESVQAYSRWAATLSDMRRVRGQAWLAEAHAWEQLGRPDSALARYDAVLSGWADPGVVGAPARYGRATLLERIGQWDRARGDYLALAAAWPSEPLAFRSLVRIVRHEFDAGEPERARASGQAALAAIGPILEHDRDPIVQRAGRIARAELITALTGGLAAEEALLDLWRRFPDDSTSQQAALAAARLAGRRPGGGTRADSILVGLRRSASSATVRREATLPAPPAGPPDRSARR
jgi:tetratricopeptide (TPR) repeat protein